MSEVLTSDATKSPLSGALLVLRLTKVRGFRLTATVINNRTEVNAMAKVTTESIFDAARAVLDEKGFEKSRLADVARKLDITPAALYKHFANKEALFEAMNTAWLEQVDGPVWEANVRAPEEERVTALHDWLWLLASRRREGFSREPEMMAFYEEQLANRDVLLDPRLQDFALAVENIMAWDTFRNQRGMTIMQTFTYFYHPFFADKWDDNLFKTLFETTWQEMLPVVEQGIVLNEEEN